ncbi:MAG: DNA polymerase III subunit delta [Pseudomonadota bacterium]
MKIRDPSSFLSRPDKPVILLYGHDEDLITTRARGLVTRLAGAQPDPFVYTHLAADTHTPNEILTQAAQIPLTGETRVVRADKVGADLAPLIDHLACLQGTTVILTAGALAPSAKLRKTCEAHDAVAVIPCYRLTAQNHRTMVRRRLAAHRVTLDEDALASLLALLPMEMGLIEREIEKLALLESPLSQEDILAVVADPAGQAMDELALAALTGDIAATRRGYAACRDGGMPPPAMIEVLTRYVERLRRVLARQTSGMSAQAALAAERVFFARLPLFTRALESWSAHDLIRVSRFLEYLAGELRRGGGRPIDDMGQGAFTQIAMIARR